MPGWTQCGPAQTTSDTSASYVSPMIASPRPGERSSCPGGFKAMQLVDNFSRASARRDDISHAIVIGLSFALESDKPLEGRGCWRIVRLHPMPALHLARRVSRLDERAST